jgi:A/G-specific adenine glycosylase
VIELCATRGELAGTVKPVPQKKREIHYALNRRNGGSRKSEVFLVQRERDASLMAGMWELPELTNTKGASSPLFTLRHSITVTDYTVRVWHTDAPPHKDGKWMPVERLEKVALTGLARKILRKAEVL